VRVFLDHGDEAADACLRADRLAGRLGRLDRQKFRAWSDCNGDLDRHFSRDVLLTNIMLYWVTGAIGSSFWPYYARLHEPWIVPPGEKVIVPMGYAEDPRLGGHGGRRNVDLLKRLGISDEVKAKSQIEPSGTEIAEAVAKGRTEIGSGVASDLSLVADIESVALPGEVQNYSLYVAGIDATSNHVDAARALIAFLTSPAVKQALTAARFDDHS
jgi:hypothetical protein